MHTKHLPALFAGGTHQWHCVGIRETEAIKGTTCIM